MPYRIALVTHATDGGVRSVVEFLNTVLQQDDRFETDFIFLATSRRDATSIRLFSPRTWFDPLHLVSQDSNGKSIHHIGAVLTEFEFRRYQPRQILTNLLDQYDLIQVVGGSPAWAWVTAQSIKPVALQIATLAKVERTAILKSAWLGRRLWIQAMTSITTCIENGGLARADFVFVENTWMLKHVQDKVGPSKVSLALPGIDTDFFQPALPSPNKKHIISVGRFSDPRKNVRLLFQAYQRLVVHSSQVPDLVLAGRTGPTPADMALADKLGIRERVHVYTNISPEELRKLYQNACMFVLSSDEEGLGIVILEAMASGLPVISTDCGGPATAVQSGITGYLTPVGNADALKEAMLDLLRDPVKAKMMGQAARAIAETRFSIQATGQVFIKKYLELLYSTKHAV